MKKMLALVLVAVMAFCWAPAAIAAEGGAYPLDNTSPLVDTATALTAEAYAPGDAAGLFGAAVYVTGTAAEAADGCDLAVETDSGTVRFYDLAQYIADSPALAGEAGERALAFFGGSYSHDLPQVGDTVTVYGIYIGYDEAAQAVVCLYGVDENIATIFAAGEAEPADAATDHEPTTGELNALDKAQSTLKVINYSYQGLVDFLEYNSFTHDEAVYAADNCGADWNEQALEKAKGTLDVINYSYTGLIDFLEFNDFTNEQAVYAADNCGADWMEQAALKAESTLKVLSYSRDGLIEFLEFNGFTHEEAVYGAEQNGF